MATSTGTTLAEQIVTRLIHSIEQGTLPPGSRLPSVRRYAQEHQISTFTVSEAYQRLVTRGYAIARKGAGYYVAPRSLVQPLLAPALDSLPIDDDWLL
ncbi:GntR family transcriptional regulator, partial [Craterilacuibacter sp.]|uniref:GntR family transcriptional regulator n=1 Tax=Craterilacuibacter sp. TaxID=2870909 RepID=UPI003F2FEAC5